MKISVKSNTKQVLKEIGRIGKSQIPFATAVALTKTAKSAQAALKKKVEEEIDNPTPFTKRGFRIKGANKRTLTSEVFIADIQSEYMRFAIEGGTRKPKKRVVIQPGVIKLNRYGNIPKGAIQRLYNKRNTFTATINGTAGLWERSKRGLKLLIAFIDEQQYTGGQFSFEKTTYKTVDRVFNTHMKIALKRAIRTAR